MTTFLRLLADADKGPGEEDSPQRTQRAQRRGREGNE